MSTNESGKTPSGLPRKAYSVEEVGEMLNEPTYTIKAHCRKGELKGAYKTGGRTSQWRIPMSAIDYYQTHQPRG